MQKPFQLASMHAQIKHILQQIYIQDLIITLASLCCTAKLGINLVDLLEICTLQYINFI